MSRTLQGGGSFAPPLTDELLASYKALAKTAPPAIGDAMQTLLNCCRKWWDLPESSLSATTPHLSGRGTVVPLDEPIKQALYEHIPYEDELNVFGQRFETIDATSQRELRNAAFHLLWHARELEMDREPITTDKL